MTREQAQNIVIQAAREVSSAHVESFNFDWRFAQALADRISLLRKALEDLDRLEENSDRGIEGDNDHAPRL